MTGRAKTTGRAGGRGNNNNNNGPGRGGRSTIRTRTVKTGLNKELEGNIFDLGESSLADLMRTTQIKIAQYIGSLYGGDIMGELETKTEFTTPTPGYPQKAKDRRQKHTDMIRAQQNNELASLRRKQTRLQGALRIIASTEIDEIDKLEEQLSEVKRKILQVEYDLSCEVELPLTEEEKGEWRQNQKAYGE